MPHRSPTQRSGRGKASAPSSIDYPTERAQRAAQRIHKACGLWPADFAKGFGPESWSVQLTAELSVLIELAVGAKDVQLEEVRQRLKTLTAKHIRSDHQRLLRSDIAKVRDWLRDDKGVDTNRPRPSTGNMVTSDITDGDEDDEDGDEDEDDADETEEELEIVAKGIEVDRGEYDEDDDLTEEQKSEKSAEEHNTPHEDRKTHEISSDDDDIVEIVPPATGPRTKPNGNFRVSSNNVNATPSPATRAPYTTATFAKPSSASSNAASNTALNPKPNRNVVLGKLHGATEGSSRSASSTSNKVTPSSPKAAADYPQTFRASIGMPKNNYVGSNKTPNSPAASSPQTSTKSRSGIISAPVGKLDRRSGANLVNSRKSLPSSQGNVASAAGSSSQANSGTANPQSTSTNVLQTFTKSPTLRTPSGGTPRTRPSSPNTAPNNVVQSKPNDPSSLTRPNGPPKTNFARSNVAAQLTPASITRPNSQARSTLSTTPSLSARPSPKRGGVLGPTQAANEPGVAYNKPASTTNVMNSGVAASNMISQTSPASSNTALTSTFREKVATAPSLIRSNSQTTASPSQSDRGQSSIAQPVLDTTSKSARSNSQPEIDPSSAPSRLAISRPRRNIQPPIRQLYDTPQSSVRLSETGQSRKRPAESPTQGSPITPNSSLPQPATATATTTSNVSTPQTHIVPAAVPSPHTTPSHNNQSRSSVAGSHTNSGINPPAKRQKTTDIGTSRPFAGAALDWKTVLPSGNEFKESLRVATAILSPTVERFEELLYAIDEERRALANVQRTLQPRRDELAHNKASATDALKDVDKETSAEKKMVQDMEDLFAKHPGDSEFRAFIDKRKKFIMEHDEVRTVVKDQLDRSTNGLAKVERELSIVLKRLNQLEEERAAVIKEKEGADVAAKQLKFMSRFMEPGWQTRLEMLESMMGDECGASQS
ncbi:hypothetical protein ACHAPI_007465 [Fusarium lateritium]